MTGIDPLPRGLKKYEPAVKALQEFLLKIVREEEGVDDWECSIFCWRTTRSGIRISELSFSCKIKYGTVGFSYMRSESECGSVILAAEDFLLTFFDQPFRPEGWETYIDEHADAKWRLEQAMKSK